MPVGPRAQIALNERDYTRVYPSPNIGDILLYEYRDATLPKNESPEYGVTTPKYEKWPNHKLVYISPADENRKQKWYYAAERGNQDLYNWEFGKTEVGGTLFDSVKRSYVKLRGSFTPSSPAINATMADLPAGVFSGTYKLFSKKQERIGEKELDALFIAESHTYLKHTGGQVKTKGVDSLVPAKYRRFTTVSETETLEDMPVLTEGNLVPDPADPSGSVIKNSNRKLDDSQYLSTSTTEYINTGLDPLVGEEYGDIVTKSVSMSVVPESSPADTGILVISSVVTPFGNGLGSKETKVVKGGVWPDPVEQESSKELPDSYPQKFRKFITRTTTTKKVGGFPSTITLGSGEIAKGYKRETPHRVEERVTSESVSMGPGDKFEGQQLNRYGTISTITESIVEDVENITEFNHLTLDVSDTPMGNGKSVRKKETVTNFPELVGYSTDKAIFASSRFTEQVVPAASVPIDHDDPLVEYQPIDALRSLKRTLIIPEAALLDYMVQVPARVSAPDMPRELVSVSVEWNENHSIGTQDYAFYLYQQGSSYAFNERANDSASSQASLSAEVSVTYRDYAVGIPMGSRYTFFMKAEDANAENIIERIGATGYWPTFRPESTTITVVGQAIQVRANVDVSLTNVVSGGQQKSNGWSRGTSDDFSVSLTNQSIQIPPCIHGEIAITGLTSKEKLVSATAFMDMFSGGSTISAVKTKQGTAFGRVSPSIIPATAYPNSVPTTGEYIVDVDASLYDYGYVKIVATTFDASSIAPQAEPDPP